MTRQRCLLLFTLIKYRAGSSRQCNKARKGNERYADQKGEIQRSLVAHDMTVFLGNSKESTKNPPRTNKCVQQGQGIQDKYIKSIVLIYTSSGRADMGIKITAPFTDIEKNLKQLTCKHNKTDKSCVLRTQNTGERNLERCRW